MVISCSAYNCTNRQNTLHGSSGRLQFHRFPFKNPTLCQKWILAVRRKDWMPTKFSFICGAHFLDDDYKTGKRRYLKEYAVPSVFNFPQCLHKEVNRNTEEKHVVEMKRKSDICAESYSTGDSTDHLSSDECLSDTTDLITFVKESTESDLKKRIEENHRAVKRMSDISVENYSIDNSTNQLSLIERSTGITNLTRSVKKGTQRNALYSSTNVRLRRKIKLLQQQMKRREKKICDLKSLLEVAKGKLNTTDDVILMLHGKFNSVPLQLLIDP